MIPDRNMFIPLPAADAIRIKAQDVDRVRPIGDHAEELEPVGRGAADRPDRDSLPDLFKSCMLPYFLARTVIHGLDGW